MSVLAATIEIQCSRSKRILDASGHTATVGCVTGYPLDHSGGRCPTRPFFLPADVCNALKIQRFLTANADRVLHRLPTWLNQIQVPGRDIYYQRSRSVWGTVSHGPAKEIGVNFIEG